MKGLISTSKGDMTVEFYEKDAPITEENYSDDGESYCRKDICFHNDDDFK